MTSTHSTTESDKHISTTGGGHYKGNYTEFGSNLIGQSEKRINTDCDSV
jgi:hypothetical protein